jgi:putative acetate kinase
MGMIIEPTSKERTEQGEQFIERLLKLLQNNDKVTVNVMYCQTCVIDSLASIESGTSYNVNLGKDGYTVLNEIVYNSHQ